MHSTLTSPSRAQELVSAFSLSAASYNHINHAFDDPSSPSMSNNPHLNPNDLYQQDPTPLERQFADLQRQRADVERVLNRPGVERSVLWDRVPAKVLRDFREMVGELDG